MKNGIKHGYQRDSNVECYDPYSNQWKVVTRIPIDMPSVEPGSNGKYSVMFCSMVVFKGCNYLQQVLSLDSER